VYENGTSDLVNAHLMKRSLVPFSYTCSHTVS